MGHVWNSVYALDVYYANIVIYFGTDVEFRA